MPNFDFIKLPQIKSLAIAAEKATLIDPRSCCIRARIVLESALHWMFDNDKELTQPYDSNLNAYLKESSFKETTPPHILSSCELIRKAGNQAAHEARPIPTATSRYTIIELHKVLYWFTRVYFDSNIESKFDASLLPTGTTQDKGKEDAQKLADQLAQKLEVERNQRVQAEDELARLRAEVEKHKAAAQIKVDTHDYSESETRKFYIDLLLSEAGWKVDSDSVKTEYELSGVKRNADRTGLGYADYVLWGNDGKPLAVIEAKRTTKDPIEGKLQAADYADAIEAKFGQRPLIYYTNGYDVYYWDDKFYPPRKVSGFFKQAELDIAIQRRSTRQPIKQAYVNKDIVDRPYQIAAIRAVCSHFEEHHRRSLVVMATGTGKTRIAIALVELLQKANWAKRVLYLCDRDSLVTQTKRAFTKHLPNTPSVDLRSTRTDTSARVCLSTYQTMMNLVDEIENGVRPFSAAHFDLIIIDEAHRSIYQKYQALFSYFDGLLLGLTATPRSEIDRNTYQLFELEDKNPTFAFELEDAIARGYLVPYEALKVSSGFTRSGIKYTDLSDEEKEEYENKFSDPETGSMPNEINSEALNRWLFNKPTVESFIRNLMEYGIKVESGDKIGKTIIFALNTDHAKFIVDCFDSAFPKYAGKYCEKIDYKLGKDAQPIIDKFSIAKSLPMIAVSVDMLDTGIDIPEVVNLVFAKPVYSQVKFWQMIGRGTRLCPNLYGPGSTEDPKADDKRNFLIFDYCGNLDYFAANPAGKVTRTPESMTSKLFKTALSLSLRLKTDDTYGHIAIRHLSFCKAFVDGLNESSFIVRPYLRYVEKYKKKEPWVALNDEAIADLTTFLAPLPTEFDIGDEDARRWDLLLLRSELALLDNKAELISYKVTIQNTAEDLLGRASIPEVKKVLTLLEAVSTDEYWEDITLDMLEEIREKMRNLIQYIDAAARKIVYSNFADKVDEITKVDNPPNSGLDLSQYRKRMDKLLEANKNHITINKIRRLIPVTSKDLEELDRLLFEGKESEKELFVRLYGDKPKVQFEVSDPPISLLIRSIIGLEREDVEKKLAEYINRSQFNPQQIAFIDTLVDFFVRDGYVPVGALYEPPFDQFHFAGPEELFGDDSGKIFDFVEKLDVLALASDGTA
jgi:type I restriction enzyme, R subunit